MLILITPEHSISNEAHFLNEMFQLGLRKLHVRKPSYSIKQYRDLIEQIEPQYHSLLTLHEHHVLIEEYPVGGIHLKERERIDLGSMLPHFAAQLKNKSKTVSSSFHELNDLKSLDYRLDYCFLSPVFDSISKTGYKGKNFKVHNINQSVIALGGVDLKSIEKVHKMGFEGMAVLGTVWNSETPLSSLEQLIEKYREYEK